MTVPVKAIERSVPAVLFIMLYNVDLTFESVSVTIQMTASRQYFHMVLLVSQYSTKLNFDIEVKGLTLRIAEGVV